jgi:MFS family permease
MSATTTATTDSGGLAGRQRHGADLERHVPRVALLVVAVMVGTTAPNALWPLFQERLAISATAVTLVFAAYALAVIASLLLVGAASDRIGRRPMLIAAVVASAGASTITLVDHLGGLVLGRLLAGVSVGMISGTAAAHLTELSPAGGPDRGGRIATIATMCGLAAGPLLAGVTAHLAPQPSRTPFVVHLGLLAVAAFALRGPETVEPTPGRWRPQRPAVPRARRLFAGAALGGFAANAQLGLYAALAPAFLAGELGRDGVLLGGLVGALLFASAGAAQVAAAKRPPTTRLRTGMALIAVASGALIAALSLGSLTVFLAATALGGVASGLGFGGGLSLANDLASPAQRGAVTSSWFVAAYLGLVGPVIGAGSLTDRFNGIAAATVFGIAISAVGLAAVITSRGAAPASGSTRWGGVAGVPNPGAGRRQRSGRGPAGRP